MRARATVIIPTYGNAKFARWAVKSVQQQTVENIEICIICDGSPEHMISFFKEMEEEDRRIKVFVYPKSPRTGEPYRDSVIKQTKGKIICYCGHDDLWLSNHIHEMERSLKKCCFTHSLHAFVNRPEDIRDENSVLAGIHCINLGDREIVRRMKGGENFFGLTYGAHTRKSYIGLEEGWVTTPGEFMYTDLFMWLKFLYAYGTRCKTTPKVTALHFHKGFRRDWTEQERDEELRLYFEKMQDPAFLKKVDELSLRMCPHINRETKTDAYTYLKRIIKRHHTDRTAMAEYPSQASYALVAGYYNNILGRDPEPGCAESWEAEIRRIAFLGIDPREGYMAVAKALFTSDEYLAKGNDEEAFINNMYLAYLNRIPAKYEVDFWTSCLAQGLRREVVINSFAFSTEFNAYLAGQLGTSVTRPECNLINDFYRGFLSRLPDTDGFKYWLKRMRTVRSACAGEIRELLCEIAKRFILSTEYTSRNRTDGEYVTDLYDGILRRGAALSEVQYWADALHNGATREWALQEFTNLPEFKERLGQLSVTSISCLGKLNLFRRRYR